MSWLVFASTGERDAGGRENGLWDVLVTGGVLEEVQFAQYFNRQVRPDNRWEGKMLVIASSMTSILIQSSLTTLKVAIDLRTFPTRSSVAHCCGDTLESYFDPLLDQHYADTPTSFPIAQNKIFSDSTLYSVFCQQLSLEAIKIFLNLINHNPFASFCIICYNTSTLFYPLSKRIFVGKILSHRTDRKALLRDWGVFWLSKF